MSATVNVVPIRPSSPNDVRVALGRDVAQALLTFAGQQGLVFAPDAPQSQRLASSIEFALGVAEGLPDDGAMRCRGCGCTDDRACVRRHPTGLHRHRDGHRYDVCAWAQVDLCTACVPDAAQDWQHPEPAAA